MSKLHKEDVLLKKEDKGNKVYKFSNIKKYEEYVEEYMRMVKINIDEIANRYKIKIKKF